MEEKTVLVDDDLFSDELTKRNHYLNDLRRLNMRIALDHFYTRWLIEAAIAAPELIDEYCIKEKQKLNRYEMELIKEEMEECLLSYPELKQIGINLMIKECIQLFQL